MCWLNFKETVRAYCSFSTAPCGGAVTGQSGVIESNGYPTQPYTDDLFCEWRLRGPLGHYLTIHFEDFNLQNSSGCERDFVEIWENHTSGQWNMSAVFWEVSVFTCYSFSLWNILISKKGKSLFLTKKCRSVSYGLFSISLAYFLPKKQWYPKPRGHCRAYPGTTLREHCVGRHPLPGDFLGLQLDIWGASCKGRRGKENILGLLWWSSV